MVPERWSIKSLGELATVERGKFSARPRNDPKFFGGKMPFVQTGDIAFSNIYLERYTQTLNEAGIDVSKVFPPGTILITIAANIGDTAITRFDVACPDSLVAIQVDPLMADAYWLKKLLETKKSILDSQATQNAQKNINLQVLKPLKVLTPPLIEQKKISQILSTWDNAIATTEQLLANSQQQKKALMQQLLTGKKRLLDESDARFSREWVDYKLTSVAEVIVSPVDKKSINDEVPVELCNYTDVYYNHHITRKLQFMKATAKISEIKKYTLRLNDVIITKDSETPGDIAVPALVSEDLGGVLCGYHLAIVRPNPEMLSGPFLNYLFSMPETRYYFFTLATGATRFGLSVGGINKAHFKLPSLNEQIAIAKVLSSTDEEISLLQQKVRDLKQEKKALMQQLLSGKRRVKVNGVVA